MQQIDQNDNYNKNKVVDSFERKLQPDIVQFQYLHNNLKPLNEQSVRRTLECIKIMSAEQIDIKKLIAQVCVGLEIDSRSLRGITWRLIIGYFPPNQKHWPQTLEKNKINYASLIEEKIQQQNGGVNDHPLSRSKDSKWNNYFEDKRLWNKILKDTKRTRIKEGFFNQQKKKQFATFEIQQEQKQVYIDQLKTNSKIISKDTEFEYDSLTRILFLWAKLNDNIYIQGMNEIAGLIYYTFATDQSEYLKQTCESDAFYCFSILMSQMKENFIKQQAEIESNDFLKDRIRGFSELLKKVDPKLAEHLQKQNVDFKFFCVKWFVVSLAQEFLIEDTLRIWDAIICQETQFRNEFVNYLCLSLMIQLRQNLVTSEFGQIIMILQNLEQNQDLEIPRIINNAYLLQKEQMKKL